MTQEDLIELGFNKILIDDYDGEHYFYIIQFGEINFISGDSQEAKTEGKWYVSTPCQTLKFYVSSEIKTVIEIFLRNQVL